MFDKPLTRRQALQGIGALVASGAVGRVGAADAVAASAAAVPTAHADWPAVHGPFGNFNPRRYGAKLVDDLKDARQVWLSEDKDLGFAKGSSSGYISHLADTATHPGTASGLIVADGRVFASSFRPVGEVWPENHVQIGPASQDGKRTAEQHAAIKRNSAYDADDFTVAVDFRTGKTLWKAVEKGKGVNRYAGKRLQFHGTPVWHAGRVFSLGTTGLLYCYDAATGKKLWEDAAGLLAREMPAVKDRLMKERKGMAGGCGMGALLVAAEGVVIVPQFSAGPGPADVALCGVDGETGRTLWELPAATCRFATPAIWSHAGRQYVLAATVGAPGKFDTGQLRLIDPKSGKVLWTLTGLAPTYYPLSPSDSHVLVNVPSKTIGVKKSGLPWGLVASCRLTPQKGELAWRAPDKAPFWFENHMDICAMRRVLIRDGRVHYNTQGRTVDPARSSCFLNVLREDTGEVLFTSKEADFSPHPGGGIIGQNWLVEDRMLNIPDAAHSDRSTAELIAADPADVRRLGARWKPPHHNTTAYEVFIELPYVDGRFLMRTWGGRIVCYDLRRD